MIAAAASPKKSVTLANDDEGGNGHRDGADCSLGVSPALSESRFNVHEGVSLWASWVV
jgi:hypothetical protein